MTVIDAQVHIRGAETPERPWPPSEAALAHRPTFLGKDELLREMDAAGVDRALIVPPYVAVKATSLPSYVTEAYPYPSLHAHIGRVAEAYGLHRVFWGIDLTRRGSYRQAVTLFTEELNFLSDIDKTSIMGPGIAEWLGWPL